ncbi:MAG: tRNA (N(6)-L-threonylcarbamoyladenosine(37)-C(2))-methylthiotransferase MtaB [Lentisphaerae bacterium]|nr:tRNA (N(6)-L-threonylcarbamoyladenosine(37)-C(2))-methylthiotransferase MtaB [Lentisphaerota bacterium]
MKRAFIITLGCRLNHADTALLTTRLQNAGYSLCMPQTPDVDLIVLNSCAITAEAEKKSRQQIRKLRRNYPGARIIAAGCAAETDPDKLLTAGADEVWSNPDKKQIFDRCDGKKSISLAPENFEENAVSSFPFRTRAFLKIQEGCDNRCSYCIVPDVRGRSRSRKFAECIADCRHAIASGFPEIVLTGVNTCNYADDGRLLGDLIREIAALPGDFRLRLGSTEPHPGDLTLPELIADPANRLCRFLHLSMQHGSDRILQAMYRRYSAQQFIDFVAKVRELVPDIHIGTDFIVGFPGETDEDFTQLLEVAEKVKFANIHAFIYSPRPGTPAAELPDRIPPQIARERMHALQTLAAGSAAAFARSQIGKTLPVIFERESGGMLHGWSDNYLAIAVPAGRYPVGKCVNVTVDEKFLTENLQTEL